MAKNINKNQTKVTEELMNELKSCSKVDSYIDSNQNNFLSTVFCDHLNALLDEKKLTRKDVILNSNMNHSYVHQIFSGLKKPSRDKIIQLAFGLKLSLEELQTLLKYGGESQLYPRIKRDSIIIYCLNKNYNLMDTDEILYDLGEVTLLQVN